MEIILDSLNEDVGMFEFEWSKKIGGIGVGKFSELHAAEEEFELFEYSELGNKWLGFGGVVGEYFFP